MASGEPLVVGVDIGTSSTKVVVFDGEGRVRGRHAAGYPSTEKPNQDKAKVRQLYAQGKVAREALLEAESRAYHAPGACTFYGTANSNQMLMEVMGLHIPGTALPIPTRRCATR